MSDIVPAAGWEEILARLASRPATAMVVGDCDSGKSTLVRWLVARLVERGVRTALVDADVGQSSLCVPGSVSLGIFGTAGDVAAYRAPRFVFLGSPNPAKVLPGLFSAMEGLTAEARAAAAAVLVDTTGLVSGAIGCGVKAGEIRSARPDVVFVLQRGDECEPAIATADEAEIFRLAPSPLVQKRSAERRAVYRASRVAAWFAAAPAREHLLDRSRVETVLFGKTASHAEAEGALRPGAVVGLNHGPETVGLGVVTEADARMVTVRSDIGSIRSINRLVAGEVFVDLI